MIARQFVITSCLTNANALEFRSRDHRCHLKMPKSRNAQRYMSRVFLDLPYVSHESFASVANAPESNSDAVAHA